MGREALRDRDRREEKTTLAVPSAALRAGSAPCTALAAPSALMRKSVSKSWSVSRANGFRLMVPTA
jgi:hypothetical protein